MLRNRGSRPRTVNGATALGVALAIGCGALGVAPASAQRPNEPVTPQALFQMYDAFNAAQTAYGLCRVGDEALQTMFASQYDSLETELIALLVSQFPDLGEAARSTILEERVSAVAQQITNAHALAGCEHEGVDSFATLYRVFAVADRDN